MKPAKDEREGWTSASSAEADALCPGRHLAQRGIPEPEQSPEAASGTRIHAWLEDHKSAPLLSDDELETGDKCVEIEQKLFAQIFSDTPTIYREKRLWIEFDGLKHSGKADLIAVCRDVALVEDYKSGRNKAPESPRNLQLRDLAALVASNFAVKTVYVAINQPWATMSPEICTYGIDELVQAIDEMERRVNASNDPESPHMPGDKQCQYCRAKAQCPAFIAALLPVASESATAENVAASVKSLSNERIGAFLALVRLAEETATAEVRQRIEAGSAVAGWTLKPGRETEKIADAQTVFNRALGAGITQDAFVRDCITVGKTALKTALKAATGAKGKALDQALDALLEGATETKVSNPVLARE